MKKFLVIFIIICLLFSFSGCYEEEEGIILDGYGWHTGDYVFYNIPQSCNLDDISFYLGVGQRSALYSLPDPLPDNHWRFILSASHTHSFPLGEGFGDSVILDEFDDYFTINKYIWIEGVDVIGSTKKRYEDIEDYPDNTIYIPYVKSFTIPAEFFKEQSGAFYINSCYVNSIEYPDYQQIALQHYFKIDYSISGNSISMTTKYHPNYYFPNKYIAYTYNG